MSFTCTWHVCTKPPTTTYHMAVVATSRSAFISGGTEEALGQPGDSDDDSVTTCQGLNLIVLNVTPRQGQRLE